jgi:hypothetical protein
MADDTFTGIWRCSYWYPSNNHDGDDVSEYYVNVRRKPSGQLVMESLPNESGAYILVTLKIDDNIATGSWEEHSSPTGEFKGMIYSGVMQLLVGPSRQTMTGLWVGVGRDRKANAAKMYSGKWKLVRAGDNATSLKKLA